MSEEKIANKDINFINLNKHAYIFKVDENYNTNMIFNLIKENLKKNLNEDISNEISMLIDTNNFSDLKVIKPTGNSIKKEQLLDLMEEFKNSSYYDWKKIYIIEFAENLTQSSANTILKFLEEPESDIIAILITKKISEVLPTILSRCEIVNLSKYVLKEYDIDEVNKVINYIQIIEKYKDKSIAYVNSLYLIKNEDLENILEIMLLIYEDCLNYLICGNMENFKNNFNEIIKISNNCEINDIIEKIKYLTNMIKMTEYNVNPRIILDSFFVGGYYE